jgi:hypothetical protein
MEPAADWITSRERVGSVFFSRGAGGGPGKWAGAASYGAGGNLWMNSAETDASAGGKNPLHANSTRSFHAAPPTESITYGTQMLYIIKEAQYKLSL